MRRRIAIPAAAVCALAAGALLIWFVTVNGLAPQPGFLSPQAQDTPARADEASGARSIDWSGQPDSVVAWVEVPGTEIDYPVVIGPASDPSYYLTHDQYGSYDIYGVPYVSAYCKDGLESKSVIVYGHNMSDGSMFADFSLYKWGDYAAEHSVAYLYTRGDEGCRELHVIAANVVNADVEEARTEFADDGELNAYLAEMIGESEVVMREPGAIDRLYTFVTCSYEYRNGRILVYAIEEGGE